VTQQTVCEAECDLCITFSVVLVLWSGQEVGPHTEPHPKGTGPQRDGVKGGGDSKCDATLGVECS
jgi:hypothetical protein